MKFQKTLLAASLAVFTVTTYAQDAKPATVTENLYNAPNPIYSIDTVRAPVNGRSATTSTAIDIDSDWLENINYNINEIDLGTGLVSTGAVSGDAVRFDVFKYQTEDGQTVYQFENSVTGAKSGIFTADALGQISKYTGTSKINVSTLDRGGQIDGSAGTTFTTGFENRRINSEHVIYGYQGGTVTGLGDIDGALTNTNGVTEPLQGSLGTVDTGKVDVRYVQQGVLANTGALRGDLSIDPSKNIYGVSARDNDNVVVMTGNGIALANISNGILQTDGSVLKSELVKKTGSGTQKTREYLDGTKRILEVYNDDTGLESEFYEITAGNDLVKSSTVPVRGTHIRTGVAERNAGTFENSVIQNTVTNKNVTYSEKVETVDQTKLNAGITDSTGDTIVFDKTFEQQAPKLKQEQAVSTGVIGKNDDTTNNYGVEVTKTVSDAEGKLVTTKSSVTAAGISTTGFIDAADYRIAGKSISASLSDAVKDAQDAAGTVKVEAVQEAKTYTDTKSTETLAAANTAAQAGDAAVLAESKSYTNTMIEQSGVSRVSKRLDNVEETANRGVAIALAASQPMPNIKPGQVAVFGGVGHYEGESAVALGAGTMLADGRTSISGAFGFAGSEIGGRVGLSYTFGQ